MPISESQMLLLARGMAQIAESYGIRLQTCGEKIDLQHLNIQKGSCISSKLLADYGIHSAYPLAKTRGDGCDCLAYTCLLYTSFIIAHINHMYLIKTLRK